MFTLSYKLPQKQSGTFSGRWAAEIGRVYLRLKYLTIGKVSIVYLNFIRVLFVLSELHLLGRSYFIHDRLSEAEGILRKILVSLRQHMLNPPDAFCGEFADQFLTLQLNIDRCSLLNAGGCVQCSRSEEKAGKHSRDGNKKLLVRKPLQISFRSVKRM